MGRKKPKHNKPPNFSQVCCAPCLGLVWSKKKIQLLLLRVEVTRTRKQTLSKWKREWERGTREGRRRGGGRRGVVGGGKYIEIRKGKEN